MMSTLHVSTVYWTHTHTHTPNTTCHTHTPCHTHTLAHLTQPATHTHTCTKHNLPHTHTCTKHTEISFSIYSFSMVNCEGGSDLESVCADWLRAVWEAA